MLKLLKARFGVARNREDNPDETRYVCPKCETKYVYVHADHRLMVLSREDDPS